MPHIEIKCYPGRTEEQKTACAEAVAEDVARLLGCSLSSVSVVIRDIPQEEWKTQVWDSCIVPDQALLYKKPGYTCE